MQPLVHARVWQFTLSIFRGGFNLCRQFFILTLWPYNKLFRNINDSVEGKTTTVYYLLKITLTDELVHGRLISPRLLSKLYCYKQLMRFFFVSNRTTNRSQKDTRTSFSRPLQEFKTLRVRNPVLLQPVKILIADWSLNLLYIVYYKC